MGQSSFDIKFLRLPRHFEIKSMNPTPILGALVNVPLPVSSHKRSGIGNWGGSGWSQNSAVISGQSSAALLWQKAQFPNRSGKLCNFQGHQRGEMITQNWQFREKNTLLTNDLIVFWARNTTGNDRQGLLILNSTNC